MLTVAQLDRARLRDELTAGRVDIAIDVAQPTGADIVHERVLDDRFCVVSARRRRRLDKAAYLAAGHVAVSSRRSGPTLEDAQFGAGVARRVVVRCQRYETACLIVAGSDLLLTMPLRQAQVRSRLLPLKLFAPPLPIPRVQLHLYRLRETSDAPASRWLRAELRALFAT
jgi:DNA-binding transcriptional LysR family regulator